MRVSITGWYGTETMGDRAILDGILSVLDGLDGNLTVKVGSLFPFYTERTFFEEREIFRRSAPKARLEIFSVKDRQELEENIASSDLVIMGGGPLMDLEELYIVRRCFRLAEKLGIPAVVMGCGIGPLNSRRHIGVVRDILVLSSAISFRDETSRNTARELYGDGFSFQVLGDPAAISAWNYKEAVSESYNGPEYCAVNFRGNPGGQYGKNIAVSDDDLRSLVFCLSREYGDVRLVPMHTFFVGGDDRYYLARLVLDVNMHTGGGYKVVHRPQNLHELYSCYMNASACIGMRYHSVFFQTILNGNNFILDYTDPSTGKIIGFIRDCGGLDFYSGRMLQLQSGGKKTFDPESITGTLRENRRYFFTYRETGRKYRDFISQCLK